jgi:hypothetical protein
MTIKNNKGIAMAAVIMTMLVLFLVGTAFVSVSAYQNTQAANHDKGMRAHYLARAGAQAALEAWIDAPNSNKPSGDLDRVYLSSANEFTHEATGSTGYFDVSIESDPLDPEKVTITSVGTVGQIEKTVRVTIDTIQSVIPAPDPNYVSGEGFYEYNSGQINAVKGSDFKWPPPGQSTKGIVKNEAKKGKGLKIPNKNTGSATQRYEKMLFVSTLQVLHNEIILESNVIVFTKDIGFHGKDEGYLILKVHPDTAEVASGVRTKDGSKWGVVIFNGVGYYFKDITGGIVLQKQSDVDDYVASGAMELITNPDELNLFLDEVLGNPLTVTSYSIVWSK